MERWLLAVETNCADPAREDEFNRWYDEVQVPDMLEVPGIMRATRYENNSPGEGQGKYLTLYEIETEDIGKTMALEFEHTLKKAEQGRSSDLKVIVAASIYRQISAPVDSR
ncbi:MAG: hypothetical protein JSW38_02865 [Dehalococcoidia bacterium]|nr:MAG: hypothetical protein JSV02_07500 [Dehalococcoidia bacterium]UCG83773.1 MAG: hypothetical protein JSW38_02865 [Dehalococcoidia bacterium]